MTELILTEQEREMLAGAEGPGVRRAMEIVVALARIYGAADLVPIRHAQIAGVSYKNLGDAGVAFLSEWADEGAQVRVPTTLNPMGMERDRWQEWGIGESFATPQLSVIEAFTKMGVTPTMSCTPYLFPDYAPGRGDTLGVGRIQRGGVREFRHRGAHQSRGRPQRHRGGDCGAHRALWLSSG